MLAQKVQVITGRTPRRGKNVPGTLQKHLHFQDYYVQKWGDPLGLVWIQNAVLQLWLADRVNPYLWGFALIVAIIAAIRLTVECIRKDLPDYGFDERGYTPAGFLHMLYFSGNIGLVFVFLSTMLGDAYEGTVELWPLLTATAGGAFWTICAFADRRALHFLHRVDLESLVPDSARPPHLIAEITIEVDGEKRTY